MSTPSKELTKILKFEETVDDLLTVFSENEVKEILRVALGFAIKRKKDKEKKKAEEDIEIPLDF